MIIHARYFEVPTVRPTVRPSVRPTVRSTARMSDGFIAYYLFGVGLAITIIITRRDFVVHVVSVVC